MQKCPKSKKKLIANRKKNNNNSTSSVWNGNYLVVIEMIPLKKSPQKTQPPLQSCSRPGWGGWGLFECA